MRIKEGEAGQSSLILPVLLSHDGTKVPKKKPDEISLILTLHEATKYMLKLSFSEQSRSVGPHCLSERFNLCKIASVKLY